MSEPTPESEPQPPANPDRHRCYQCGEQKPWTDFREAIPIKRPPFMSGWRVTHRCSSCRAAYPSRSLRGVPNRSRVVEGGGVPFGVIELTDRYDRTVAEARVSVEDLPRVLAAGRWGCLRGRAVLGEKQAGLAAFVASLMGSRHVGHANGDRLDCRRENLRVCDQEERPEG